MAESMQMPVLLPAEEGNETQGVALDRAICLVGARARVHLPLPSPQVSKSHALIVNDQDRVYIRDLASKNHTYVNDRPVKEAALDQSDEIRIGRYKFRCGPGFTKSPPPVIYETPRAQLQIDGSAKVDFSGKTALIGARSGCDVRLKGEEVAPVHAVIFERNGKRFVRDLNSGIGTGVNGVAIHEEQLKDGDELSIGGVTIRYNLLDQATNQPKAESTDSLAEEPKPLEISLGDDSDLPIALVGEGKLVENDKKSEAAADAIPLADEPDHLPVVGQSFDSSSSLSIKSGDSKAGDSNPNERSAEIDSLIPLADEAPPPLPAPEKPAMTEPIAAEAKDKVGDRLHVERESSPELVDLAEIVAPQTPRVEPSDSPAPLAEPEPQRKIEINMSEADIDDEIAELAEPEESEMAEETAAQKQNEIPSPQRITHLVGEIAEKAQELETAWRDYSHGHNGDADHPGTDSQELERPSKAQDADEHERSSNLQSGKEKSID